MISFTVYGRPEPQGSSKAFVIGGKARITSANPKMKSFRQEVTRVARQFLADANLPEPLAGHHVPVALKLDFYFRRPRSAPKKRSHMVVAPDADKLARAAGDALTGVLYHDDSQVVDCHTRKHYDQIERVEIKLEVIA